MEGAGRFAPSPSGDLHLGNLRTALLAWLFARTSGRDFLIRVEDLDRVRPPGAMERQLDDLRRLGLTWDGPVVLQSHRLPLYHKAIDQLRERDLTYPCFCTRKEILQAPSAPPCSRRRLPRHVSEPFGGRTRREIGKWPISRAEATGRHRLVHRP